MTGVVLLGKAGVGEIFKFRVAICLLVSLTSCETVQLAPPPHKTMSGFSTYLDQTIPRLLSNSFPGAEIALVEKGRTIYEKAFGTADRKKQTPVSTDTVFQVASISKTVTAWGILKLVEKKKIELDAPIWNYIHRWKLPPSSHDAQRISVRSILAHRSGLSLVGYPGYAPGERVPTIEESLSGDNGAFYGFYRMGPVIQQDEAWSKFLYSGGGYTLLQLLIEEVSGQPFSEFMQTEILEPLAMTHSSFDFTDTIGSHVSRAYSNLGWELPNYVFVEKAAAGLYTTAGDLAILLNELFRIYTEGTYQSRALSSEFAKLFYTDNPFVKEGEDVFGYFRLKTSGRIAILSHSGANQGWRAYYAIELRTGKGIVFLTNSDAGFDAISAVVTVFDRYIL